MEKGPDFTEFLVQREVLNSSRVNYLQILFNKSLFDAYHFFGLDSSAICHGVIDDAIIIEHIMSNQ